MSYFPSFLKLLQMRYCAFGLCSIELSELVEVVRIKVLPGDERLEHRSELTETFVWLLAKVIEHCINNRIAMHRLVVADSSYVSLRTTIVFKESNDVVLRP